MSLKCIIFTPNLSLGLKAPNSSAYLTSLLKRLFSIPNLTCLKMNPWPSPQLQTSAFLPISVNGNPLLPVTQVKPLGTFLMPPLSPSCTPLAPTMPHLTCWPIQQANLVAILQKYILLNWNPSKNIQNSTTSHHLHYYNLGQPHHHFLPGFLQSSPKCLLSSLSTYSHPAILQSILNIAARKLLEKTEVMSPLSLNLPMASHFTDRKNQSPSYHLKAYRTWSPVNFLPWSSTIFFQD